MREIRIFENADDLTAAAAALFVEIAVQSISERGRFAVGLSGGSTPAPVYKLVADRYRDLVDWKKVFFFFGDERNVPSDSVESNFRMANNVLFSPLRIGEGSVHEWKASGQGPVEAAANYELDLKNFFKGFPRFDLMLLGLGNDCHTASLFPNTSALKVTENIAVANWVAKLDTHRLTLTFPVINNAANIMIIVSGEEKAEAAAQVLEGEFRPEDFPAQLVNPQNGNLYWLLDAAAASKLKI